MPVLFIGTVSRVLLLPIQSRVFTSRPCNNELLLFCVLVHM